MDERVRGLLKKLPVLGALLAILVQGCGPQIQTTVDRGDGTVPEAAPYRSPMARTAVARFDCKAAKCYGEIGYGLADMLSTALFRSGMFVVLERGEGLYDIQRELNLSREGYTDPGKAPTAGKMEGADILIMGAITEFEPDASGFAAGGVIVPYSVPFLGGVAVEKDDAYIGADIRLVDVASGRIIHATRVEGFASSYRVGITTGTIALGAGFSTYQNTPMEKAVRVMLDNAVKEIALRIPRDYYRYNSQGEEILSYVTPPRVPPKRTEKHGRAYETQPRTRGGAQFHPGQEVVFAENYSRYHIGDIPGSMNVSSGQIEVAEFSNARWLRCLSDVRMAKRIDLSRDFSIEFTVYKPQSSPNLHFSLGSNIDSPERITWGEDITWKGKKLISYRVQTGLTHHFALERRGDTLKVFVDDRLLVDEPLMAGREGHRRDGFLLTAEYVNVSKGEELLITDLRVAYY